MKNDQTKPKRRRTLRTPARPEGEDWAPDFLRELARCGVVRTAAQKAKVGRRTVYDRVEKDLEFAAAFADAMEDAADDIEESSRRRAKAKSDKLAIYFLNLRYRPGDQRKHGRTHLHLHQHLHHDKRQEQLTQQYEAMPNDELQRQYQEQIESKLAAGPEAGTPAAGTGPVPA